ncbi:MAG: hypothetical protein JXR97_11915 [Planctomycetes bacterium]|nr:hypothetical protein [Planctomycetota bacterium]
MAQLTVDANIPAGNIIIDDMKGVEVFLQQDMRDTGCDWFYWKCRVCGGEGRTISFRFTGVVGPIGLKGPCFSTDRGESWKWLGLETVANDWRNFSYSFGPDEKEVWFCVSVPYLESDLNRFLDRHQNNPALRKSILCTSRKGRAVELLHIGCIDREPAHRVLLSSRHHCCEMMATWSLEGLLETVLGESEDGNWLRANVEFAAVPFMDKDGVEDGDQGKGRTPHDHNRDYGEKEGIYPETRALKSFATDWAKGKLRSAIDMHCPWLRGEHNEVIYQVGCNNENIWQEQIAFGKILEEVRTGEIPYLQANDLAFGTAWNTAANYSDKMSCAEFYRSIPGIVHATTLEVPYAEASGATVSSESAKAFGRDMARALRIYLEQL